MPTTTRSCTSACEVAAKGKIEQIPVLRRFLLTAHDRVAFGASQLTRSDTANNRLLEVVEAFFRFRSGKPAFSLTDRKIGRVTPVLGAILSRSGRNLDFFIHYSVNLVLNIYYILHIYIYR